MGIEAGSGSGGASIVFVFSPFKLSPEALEAWEALGTCRRFVSVP